MTAPTGTSGNDGGPWGRHSCLPGRQECLPHQGVNVCGYLRTESGVGDSVRRYVRAFRAGGVPVALKDVSDLNVNRAEDPTLQTFEGEHPHGVNLVCADIELHYAVWERLGEDFFKDRYNVALWWWELPRLPRKWHDRFAWYDEVWVGTSFVANGLGPVAPVPVVRIPPVLTVEAPGSREAGRRRLGAPPEEFVFLFVFDFHSHFERKNPLAAVRAFRSAFAVSDRARLVIKCVNGKSNEAGLAALREEARGHRIDVLDGYWPAGEVRDLMAACDAYVSLHRSEGAGLTITDAMALGKPVVATGWSGNMDFMTVSNSFPVRYRLVELARGVGPYPAGECWAEPSVEHAAELMRRVYRDRDEGTARGRQAARDVETHYSPEPVAGLLRDRLDAIALRRNFPAFRDEVKARFASYRLLPRRIREVVGEAVPPGAVVAVVSKGDEELLRLDGREAWHFPRRDDGSYTGYYPEDSAAAVGHLEELRARGARFLLLPRTAFWWLEHYGGFKDWLDRHCRRIVEQDACLIFAL